MVNGCGLFIDSLDSDGSLFDLSPESECSVIMFGKIPLERFASSAPGLWPNPLLGESGSEVLVAPS